MNAYAWRPLFDTKTVCSLNSDPSQNMTFNKHFPNPKYLHNLIKKVFKSKSNARAKAIVS